MAAWALPRLFPLRPHNLLYWLPDRGIFILNNFIDYIGNVWNVALGSFLMFVVIAIAGSFATQNLDALEILRDGAALVFITLALYSLGMAYVVYLYDDESWWKKYRVLMLIRLGFTLMVAIVGYFLG